MEHKLLRSFALEESRGTGAAHVTVVATASGVPDSTRAGPPRQGLVPIKGHYDWLVAQEPLHRDQPLQGRNDLVQQLGHGSDVPTANDQGPQRLHLMRPRMEDPTRVSGGATSAALRNNAVRAVDRAELGLKGHPSRTRDYALHATVQTPGTSSHSVTRLAVARYPRTLALRISLLLNEHMSL